MQILSRQITSSRFDALLAVVGGTAALLIGGSMLVVGEHQGVAAAFLLTALGNLLNAWRLYRRPLIANPAPKSAK